MINMYEVDLMMELGSINRVSTSRLTMNIAAGSIQDVYRRFDDRTWLAATLNLNDSIRNLIITRIERNGSVVIA